MKIEIDVDEKCFQNAFFCKKESERYFKDWIYGAAKEAYEAKKNEFKIGDWVIRNGNTIFKIEDNGEAEWTMGHSHNHKKLPDDIQKRLNEVIKDDNL